MLSVNTVEREDDLNRLVEEINQAVWDAGNEMSTYHVAALAAYLERQDTVFIVCHSVDGQSRTFYGMASARLELKPYDNSRWLYVDEVDVCADQRQKGAGKALMRKLIEIAKQNDCEEVWLGTEVDNLAANALYRSLNPDDAAQVVGYTYELDD